MCHTIEDLKANLLKLLTLEEYIRSLIVVSLLSYSGKGDVRNHFERVPISDMTKRDLKYAQEIRKIHTAGPTCMTQALEVAKSLVREGEPTAVTLHSDGFTTEPNNTSEAERLADLCASIHRHNAFVTTIAYTDHADYRLLSRMANVAGGACVRAGKIQHIYESLHDTMSLLGGPVSPPLDIAPQGAAYQIFVSRSGRRIFGSMNALHLCGLRAGDDAKVYRYRRLTRDEYDRRTGVPVQQNHESVYLFARAKLAEGHLNTAKYALASTFNAPLADRHGKALTNTQIADLATDLERVIFHPATLEGHEILDHIRVNRRIPVISLARMLEENRDGWTLNLDHLRQTYVRRGLRRVPGARDENGKLTEPWLKTELVDTDHFVPVTSFSVNHNCATLNMLVGRRARLVRADNREPITSVAGIRIDSLTSFENFTIVGDGELNLAAMHIRISKRDLFERLIAEGVLEWHGAPATRFDATTEYTLRLDQLPLVPTFDAGVRLAGVFDELAELKILTSIVAAHIREESEILTPDQVEELKRHYLSKNLHLNFPTTTEYVDLQQALAAGSVDIRTTHRIDFGTRKILNLGKLHSANKFLERHYEVTVNGQKLDRPVFDAFLGGPFTVTHKPPSSRTKLTPVDELMKRVFDDFFGLADTGGVKSNLKRIGAAKLAAVLANRKKGVAANRSDLVSALLDAKGKLESTVERLFADKVSPLVFFVGATGVLPDEIDVPAQTADQIEAKHPDLVISKDERDGLFFEIGDTILTVYTQNEYFSR
jgi:hypothetical protein